MIYGLRENENDLKEHSYAVLLIAVLLVLLFSDTTNLFKQTLHRMCLTLYLTGLKYMRMGTGEGMTERRMNTIST